MIFPMHITLRTIVLPASVVALLLPLSAVATTASVAVGPVSSVSAPAAGPNVLLKLPEFGFTIRHPKAWSVEKEEQSDGVMNVILSSEADQFYMTLTLAKSEKTLKPSDLEALVTETLAALRSDGTTVTVTKTEKGRAAGASAKVLTATAEDTDGTLLQERQVYFVKGKVACVMFLISTPELYGQNLRTFNKILRSASIRRR